MKKVFLTIVLLSSFLLTGCVNDEKKTQQNNQPESKEPADSSDDGVNPPFYF